MRENVQWLLWSQSKPLVWSVSVLNLRRPPLPGSAHHTCISCRHTGSVGRTGRPGPAGRPRPVQQREREKGSWVTWTQETNWKRMGNRAKDWNRERASIYLYMYYIKDMFWGPNRETEFLNVRTYQATFRGGNLLTGTLWKQKTNTIIIHQSSTFQMFKWQYIGDRKQQKFLYYCKQNWLSWGKFWIKNR